MPSTRLANIMLRLVTLTAALVIPLVFYLNAYEVFELAKSTVLKVMAGCAAAMIILRGQPMSARSLTAALLFLLACSVSLLATPLVAASAERIWEIAAVMILLFAAESRAVSRNRLLTMVIFAYALVTMYGGMQYLGIDTIRWTTFGEKRVYSTLGNPDFLAAQGSFLIPVIFCLIFANPSGGIRWLLILMVLIALPSLLYTQARGAYLGFMAACLALGLLVHRFVFRLKPGDFLKWLSAGVAAFVLLVAVLPTGRHFIARFTEFRDPVKSSSVQIRLFYWYAAWLMGRSDPLTGTGIGAFHLAGSRAQGEALHIWMAKWPRAAEVVSPHLELYAHNDYVHLFAVIGPLGLGLYLWIMIALFAAGLSALRRLPPGETRERWLLIGLLAAAVSFYVNSLTNFPLKVVSNLHVFFSCLVAFLLAPTAIKPQKLAVPRNRVAVLLLLAGAFYLGERACAKLIASNYLKFGHRYLLAGAAKPAIPPFEKSISLRPYHTDAILANFYSGKALQNLGRFDDAIISFGRAINIFTDFPEGHQARGIAELALASELKDGDRLKSASLLRDSARDLERALLLNPKESSIWFYLGTVKRLEGDPSAAVTAFEKAIHNDREGRIPDAYSGLALSLAETRRPADARRILEAMLARFPGNPEAIRLLRELGKRPGGGKS